jgi:hypothetical protein
VVRKKIDPAEAKISKVPVELNDAPLVIDLPDGQKIILGKMQNGAVIEVATWHGTGRPDSRTNRFMIGMTSGDSTSPSQSAPKSSEPSPSKKSRSFDSNATLGKVGGFLTLAKTLVNSLTLPLKNALNKTKELAPVDTTTELEINAWLNSITSEATKKVERNTAPSAKKVVKKSAPKKK